MDKATEFLKELETLCRKHNISISHQDSHGGFILIPYADWCTKWMWEAINRLATTKEADNEQQKDQSAAPRTTAAEPTIP